MEKKFDVTLKALLEDAPEDWSVLAGECNPHVEVIDADIATISGAADKVLRLKGASPSIQHFEFQAGPDASLPRRANVYNSALEDRHDLPVASIIVLLRPEANLRVLTGEYQRYLPGVSEPYRIFRYRVIRVWELPVQSLLGGGLGQLALAPISAVSELELPALVGEMKRRVARVRDRGRIGRWWTAVYVLMGMRYRQTAIDQLLQGVLDMEESVTYQAIVQKGVTQGAVQEARKILLRLGETRFRKVSPADIQRRAGKIEDLEQLEQLLLQVTQLHSWDELREALPKQRRSPSSGSGTTR